MKHVDQNVKEIPRNCSTCKYGRNVGCNNEKYGNWWSLKEIFEPCPYYEIDRRAYPTADIKKGALA